MQFGNGETLRRRGVTNAMVEGGGKAVITGNRTTAAGL